MRYGLKRLKWREDVKNLKLYNQLRTRSLAAATSQRIQYGYRDLFFYLPYDWKISIFKFNKKNKTHNLFYLYSSYYFFYFSGINYKNFIFFSSFTSVLHFRRLFTDNFFYTYWNFFKNIFFSFSKVYFKKLKFKGKGYYVYKGKRNTVATQFGFSHMTRVFGYNISLKFLTKTIILIFGINKFDILTTAKKLYFQGLIIFSLGKVCVLVNKLSIKRPVKLAHIVNFIIF